MEIKRIGSQPLGKGQAEYFTGRVRVDPLNQMSEPGRVGYAYVTFEPSARTAWYTHPTDSCRHSRMRSCAKVG